MTQTLGSLVDLSNVLDVNARNVKVRVRACKVIGNDPERWIGISPSLVIEDGVLQEDGSYKFKGKYLFPTICVGANPEANFADGYKEKIKGNQHLIDLQYFLKACGIDANQLVIENHFVKTDLDALCEQIINAVLTVNIGVKKDKSDNIVNNYRQITDDQVV